MKNITKTIEWKTGNGLDAKVTVALETERYVGRNDFVGEITKPCCTIKVSATINGQDAGGLGYVQKIDAAPAVARIGKLGMTKTNADRVYAAIKEIENTEYVQAWREKERAAVELERKYEEDYARISQALHS